MTVPVHVPSDNALGSAEMMKLSPSGGMTPFDGATLSHGLSTVAKKDVVTLGRPGTWIGNVTGVLLPAGTGMLMFNVPSGGTGMMTIGAAIENAPGVWLQPASARTRYKKAVGPQMVIVKD